MEINRVALFESIALTSVTLPYYSIMDRSFLFLSTLWSGSRKMMNEFYGEFKHIMRAYSVSVHLRNMNISMLRFPWDLFNFSITINSEESVKMFISIISDINEN